MNARTFIAPTTLLALSLLAAPAFANGGAPQDSTTLKPVRAIATEAPPQKIFKGHQATQLLALETNVRPRDVHMIETHLRRGLPYDFRLQQRAGKRFAEALGPERYTAWSQGRPIQLYSPAVIEAARRMAGNVPDDRAAEANRVAVNP